MNRRSILSSLCTGALALLAPVVAWAGKRRSSPPVAMQSGKWYTVSLKQGALILSGREVDAPLGFSSIEVQERALPPRADCGRAPSFTSTCECHQCVARRHSPLRALLAEAREVVARKPITFKQKDGTTRDYIIPLDTDADLLNRIDAVLKEKV